MIDIATLNRIKVVLTLYQFHFAKFYEELYANLPQISMRMPENRFRVLLGNKCDEYG